MLRQFVQRHPRHDGLYAWHHPVVHLECYPAWSARALLEALTRALGDEYSPGRSVSERSGILVSRLRRCEVRVLALDEFHNLLEAKATAATQMLALLRSLGNETGISIVAARTRTAVQAVRLDAQLENRFDVKPMWTLD